MQSAHWMHSSWRAVADVDAGRADGDALQAIDAIAAPFPGLPQLVRRARLAAPLAVGDEQRLAIEHRALNARPGAHIDADLLAGDAAKHIGGGGEDADEEIGEERRVEADELPS